MESPKPKRTDRLHSTGRGDQRNEFQRDRDRVLYSSAFQRLAGITQIVKAGEESIFHTRQQHTIKVAQVGRRLAESLVEQRRTATGGSDAGIAIDPEVVEAACLIHDLGHPPFGHAGEKVLDELVTGHADGFEGNAQSFRIVTKLAIHKHDYKGLNLTRATLAATLKYPWKRGDAGTLRHAKWSAYASESDDFAFATEGQPEGAKTIEAELMDWADDIAYSVHDLEDFHRCSVIPWTNIFSPTGKKEVLAHITDRPGTDLEQSFDGLPAAIMDMYGEELRQRYEGTRDQRLAMRSMTSTLINIYVSATSVAAKDDDGGLKLMIDPKIRGQIAILKQITRDHVIKSASLAAQQVGYRKIIEGLFAAFNALPDGRDVMPAFTPVRLQYLWPLRNSARERFAADCVAALTEAEAVGLYARLNGFNSGSVLDPIVR